jgi:hypothetical protein
MLDGSGAEIARLLDAGDEGRKRNGAAASENG